MKLSIIFVSLLLICSTTFCLEACRFSLACELKMTDTYIESSCGLTNGVRFEELDVDTFYADGKPKIYRVICRYSANPYANGPASEVKDRIYFDGRNDDCYWRKDSATNGIYKDFGVSRERIDSINDSPEDSIVKTITHITHDSMVVTGYKPPKNEKRYSNSVAIKCPLRFKSKTWYYVDFWDQRYAAYLYVDSNMAYNLFKINFPTNF